MYYGFLAKLGSIESRNKADFLISKLQKWMWNQFLTTHHAICDEEMDAYI